MDRKTLNSLRIGDTVRIHLTHIAADSTEPRGKPFDVVIAKFNDTGRVYKDENDGRYYENRQVGWYWANMPKELQPDERHRDDVRGLDSVNEDWIVELVARGPYHTVPQHRNALYTTEQSQFFDRQKIDAHRRAKGERQSSFGRPVTTAVGYRYDVYNEDYQLNIGRNQYNGHLFQLAEALIARRPGLTVTNCLDPDRFYAAWNKAGRPGYVGPYQPTSFSSFMRNRMGDRIDPSPYKAVVNLKAFTKWVVRNISRFTMTKATELSNMIQSTKEEEEANIRMMERDMEEEFGARMSSVGSSDEMDYDDDVHYID